MLSISASNICIPYTDRAHPGSTGAQANSARSMCRSIVCALFAVSVIRAVVRPEGSDRCSAMLMGHDVVVRRQGQKFDEIFGKREF